MAEVSLLARAKSAVYWALSKPIIRRTYERGTTAVLKAAGSSRVASHLLHTAVPIAFSREQPCGTGGSPPDSIRPP